jgi:peptidoglycan/LPS O-acetylase OafA/YrhL
MDPTSRRIPSLDGLRALSIGLVLVGHLEGTARFPLGADEVALLPSAQLGVRIFFVISGYLITTLLLRELGRAGRIDLKRFYQRRAWRIFPALYLFVACLALAERLGWVQLRPHDLAHAVSYTVNYHQERAWQIGHLWSLSVEEQFYLLWPALLSLAGARRGLCLAGAYVLLAPAVRVGCWFLLPGSRAGIGETFETAADALAAGCLLAGVAPWLVKNALYRRFQGSRLFLLVPLAVYAADRVSGYVSFSYTVGETIMNAGIAVGIHWCLTFPRSPLGRLLNSRPLTWVGAMSYSLYLWQQPFLDRQHTFRFTAFPVNLAAAALLAIASYYLVERIGLRLRDRQERAQLTLRAGSPASPALLLPVPAPVSVELPRKPRSFPGS